MDIIKAFNTNNLNTEIVIKGTHENPLFRASDIALVLDIVSIRSIIRNYNDDEKVTQPVETMGGRQNITFLTEKGLYKILFKSRKPNAETFQNWVCDMIKEIRLKGKYNLEELEKIKTEMIQNEETHKKEFDTKVSREREQILLREFGTIGSIVYIIKVKTYETGEYIIKIGESRIGIQMRYNEHKTKYDEILLLDCFSVKKSKDFEHFLHNHEMIKYHKKTDLPNHETERELFIIGKGLSYRTLLQIIHANINHFNDYNQNDLEKLKHENEVLKQMMHPNQPFPQNQSLPQYDNQMVQDMLYYQKEMMAQIQNLEKMNIEILQKLNSLQTKTTTNFNQSLVTVGPRLQQINPETITINKVYESIAECIKEYNYKLKRPSIMKAITDNTIYHGFRWAYVDRELDANIITNLPNTKPIKVQNNGYVAKINKEKTEIINVFIDRKTTCILEKYNSITVLDTPMKQNKLYNGFYYMLYENCDTKWKMEFVAKYGEPILYKTGIGQYNSEQILIKEFVCKYDCIKQLKMSDKTLAKALEQNLAYNTFYFKELDSKLKMV
jgi:prophage antirepressor-like protein